MHYTIYKTTHKSSGKIYIGKHQTENLDDGYMGSGKHLKRAINKYGVKEFSKEILFELNSEAEMNEKEAELVTPSFVERSDTYNLCSGGQGGFGHINSNVEFRILKNRKARRRANDAGALEIARHVNTANRRKYELNPIKCANRTCGEYLEYLDYQFRSSKYCSNRCKSMGSSNSQYGTMWITNGTENRKIRKSELIPENWYRGRVLRKKCTPDVDPTAC